MRVTGIGFLTGPNMYEDPSGLLTSTYIGSLPPASIFPSGGVMLSIREGMLTVFLRCEHNRTGAAAWDCAGKAVLACLGGDDRLVSFKAAFATFMRVQHR